MGALNLSLASIANALGGEVKQNDKQNYVIAPGPGHSKKDRSLKVTLDANAPDGFLVHSFSSGDDDITCKDYVRDKLGLPGWKSNGGQTPPTEYIYRDENGEPYVRVSRTKDKKFLQAHWDGKQWQWGKPKGPKIPYRLEQLRKADTVFVVEGEKDADRLTTIGLVATTNTEGADNGTGSKWTSDLNRWFVGKTVYILPDNDDAGRKHASHVASNLHDVAHEVRVVPLPGLPPKGDVSDWFDRGGDADKLLALCRDAPVWTPAANVVVKNAPNWRDIRDKHGNPLATLANAVIAVKALGVACRQNLFHHTVLVSYRGESSTLANRIGELTDDTLGAIRSLINDQFCLDVGEKNTIDAVMQIARENEFDPVLDYLSAVEGGWDGVDRLTRWLTDYCGAEDTKFNRAIGRKHLIASVRRARQPGVKYDDVLVMESPEGRNKSTAIEILAGRENFSDQTILGTQDRVAQELITGVWLYEIADLTGIARAEVDKIKAFASRNTDRARPAYGHVVERRPRRCTFWGTTNDDRYLKSQTGNRRFLPVKVGRVDVDALRRDRDQLWGEAAAAETAEESIMLAEELWSAAADEQEKRRVLDPWEEILADIPKLIPTISDLGGKSVSKKIIHCDKGEERVATRDILTYVLKVPPAQQNSSHGQRLASIMERNGWQRPATTLRIDGKPTRGYWRQKLLV